MSKLEAAAIRYANARRARTITREAQRNYWRSVWPSPPVPDPYCTLEQGYVAVEDRYHGYGQCRGGEGDYSPTFPLCVKCAGSEPAYQAYKTAAKEQGLALRALMRLVK